MLSFFLAIFHLFLLLFIFWSFKTGSHYIAFAVLFLWRAGWFWIHRDPPVSISWAVGLKIYATMSLAPPYRKYFQQNHRGKKPHKIREEKCLPKCKRHTEYQTDRTKRQHIVAKTFNVQNKESIFKVARQKQSGIMTPGLPLRAAAGFSTDTLKPGGLRQMFYKSGWLLMLVHISLY